MEDRAVPNWRKFRIPRVAGVTGPKLAGRDTVGAAKPMSASVLPASVQRTEEGAWWNRTFSKAFCMTF